MTPTHTAEVQIAYLLGEQDPGGITVRESILSRAPDGFFFHCSRDLLLSMAEVEALHDDERGLTLCAQREQGDWLVSLQSVITCPDCGEALVRHGRAVPMPLTQALALQDQLQAKRQQDHGMSQNERMLAALRLAVAQREHNESQGPERARRRAARKAQRTARRAGRRHR